MTTQRVNDRLLCVLSRLVQHHGFPRIVQDVLAIVL